MEVNVQYVEDLMLVYYSLVGAKGDLVASLEIQDVKKWVTETAHSSSMRSVSG